MKERRCGGRISFGMIQIRRGRAHCLQVLGGFQCTGEFRDEGELPKQEHASHPHLRKKQKKKVDVLQLTVASGTCQLYHMATLQTMEKI